MSDDEVIIVSDDECVDPPSKNCRADMSASSRATLTKLGVPKQTRVAPRRPGANLSARSRL